MVERRNKKEEITKKVLLYLIHKLESEQKIEGRKKIMKLMFLIEHYDLKTKKLEEKSLLGNKYFIYNYGVFSVDVMRAYEELVKEGLIIEKIIGVYPIIGVRKDKVMYEDLDEDLKRKVDDIVREFGGKSSYELEILTLKMLGIEPFEKEEFFGEEVFKIISRQKN